MTDHEQQRLAALHEYRLLDAPADDELEAVVRVAAVVAGVPFATLNLIDEHRQCQLTTTGFEGGDSTRRDSMCAIRFEAGEFVWVPDASLDPTYQVSPWVTGELAKVRFYASAPLVTPQGHALGSLCVFDTEPGELSQAQIDRLEDLAQVILALFERRRQARLNYELLAASEQQHQELRRTHAELAAVNAELQRSNTELEQFAGVVSHDLAAPLAVVNGYLELLGDEQPGTGPAQAWIASATRAVARMQRLIEALLTYAQAGSGPCRTATAGVADLAGQAITDLRRAIDEAGAEVTVPAGLPAVHGDPTLIRQLLQNLIGNAVKYRSPARTCQVAVGAERLPDGWAISVADNGVGIPAEHRARVFEMFTRVDRTQAGHGVGLSTCQRIVERHGGRIWVDGAPGGGTTVTFTLPDA
ncbi:ATP-binding protein [Actinoplanes sp. NPDC051633]|uniref:sensor histidine kinase n=1 Tax=Actinoplanes sp. NPDC051633 TaxID=3155670 RepID=UPI00342B0152